MSAAAPQDVDVRAVNIRPAVVTSITPIDLDIVIERLDPLAASEQFDLIVATNVFVYYSRFEQALAATNIARMLRPGGVLLSNTDVFTLPPMRSAVGYLDVAYSGRQADHIFSYQRQ
jgi:2-polyprenyl-3-methyl-5-hydroxy-6-metoxy-1,4-benzoquinol methylase